MPRKALLAITIVWAVLLGGAYAVAIAVPTFTATRLDGTGSSLDQYRWNGQPIVIERARSKKRYTVACDVTPDRGGPRTLTVQFSTRGYAPEFTSWFSGSANMVCHGDARIYSGLGKQIHQLTKNKLITIPAAVLAFGPLVAVYVFGLGSRRKA